jgi:hypothetical protein
MNPLIEVRKPTLLFIAGLLLACFVLAPKAFGVVPAPDGGYPGGNTAEGQAALLSLTSGGFNTAVGWLALRSNTQNGFNTAVGAGALFANISAANTATGAGALLSTTTGGNNTANGALALLNNTMGQSNTAIGSGALLSNVDGYNNTATGFHALFNNTTGLVNTAIGESALFINTAGGSNTAIGSGALQNNTTGSGNTALGIAAGSGVTTAQSVICIGTPGANVSNSCFIGRIRGITTAQNDAIPIFIDSAGQLGTMSSSRRFKNDITPMDQASQAILALKPVTFHYTSDKTNRPEFGLIAEDVAEVDPDLVVRDDKGEIYTVRYEAVNAMLLNEFLKEHKRVEEQQAVITELKSTIAKQDKAFQLKFAQQQKQIDALASGLQQVNAIIDLQKPAVGVVAKY